MKTPARQFRFRSWVWVLGLTLILAGDSQSPAQPVLEDEPEFNAKTWLEMQSEVALSAELQVLAKTPLPPWSQTTQTLWRDKLAPVFSFIDRKPIHDVKAVAYKLRRDRIRVTEKDRKASEAPFQLLKDQKQSPELYWGHPIAIHGYVTKLQTMPAPQGLDAAADWHQGWLTPWNEEGSVRFVVQKLPQGFLTSEKLHEPITLIGYLFSLEGDEEAQPPKPLIIARWVRRFEPILDVRGLSHLKDKAIGLPEAEEEAYYRTLLNAALVDQKVLKQQADDFWEQRQTRFRENKKRLSPLFVDLFNSFSKPPFEYRGKAVTITGMLRKLRKFEATPENDYGLQTLYEGWIYNEDAQTNPVVVVFSENPDNLAVGDEVAIPVTVTGYVFKLYGYESRDPDHPLRLAPMLLAKRMTSRQVAEPESFPVIWLGAALVLLCGGIVLIAWSSHRRDKKFREVQAQKDDDDPPPTFDNITADE